MKKHRVENSEGSAQTTGKLNITHKHKGARVIDLKPEELMARNSKSSRATKRKEVRMASTAEELHAVFYLPSCKVHTKNRERKCTMHYN